MRRRRWRLLVLALAAVLIGGGVHVWLEFSGPRVSYEAYAQIQRGMTRAEVETIIGAPAGDYGRSDAPSASVEVSADPPLDSELLSALATHAIAADWAPDHDVWNRYTCEITVNYDAKGRVTSKVLRERRYDLRWPPLLQWLGIQ